MELGPPPTTPPDPWDRREGGGAAAAAGVALPLSARPPGRCAPRGAAAGVAGRAADRWRRKRLMVGADGVRMVAIGGLAVLLVTDRLSFWLIPIVAFVEGAGAAVFGAAEVGALRSVVPAPQLPAAAATQTGR